MMKKFEERHTRFYPPGVLRYWLLPSAPLDEAAEAALRVWCDVNVSNDVAIKVANEVKAIAELLSLSDDDYATFLDIYINYYHHSDPLETGYYVKYPDL
jgi:Na+-transporting NADH:ubiquinone oxidoreductase subunit NqrF